MEIIMSIAGSDSSAGAGIQQDLKVATYLGSYCATVITAVTAQNTMGVKLVTPIQKEIVRSQIRAILEDMAISAVKIGMVPNIDCATTIVEEIHNLKVPIVCDPVMVSTSGTPLMTDECIKYVTEELFPLCALITPNIPEWERIKNISCISVPILKKGGHLDGDMMNDILIMPDKQEYVFSSPRISTSNLHGTGCTMSTAIASYLAKGQSLINAVQFAKEVINNGIEGGKDLRLGKGNGPLWFK